jgi:hypothetical protein
MFETAAVFVTFPRHARRRRVDLALALAMLNKALRARSGVVRASRRAGPLELLGEPGDRHGHAKPLGA